MTEPHDKGYNNQCLTLNKHCIAYNLSNKVDVEAVLKVVQIVAMCNMYLELETSK